MRKVWIVILIAVALIACDNKDEGFFDEFSAGLNGTWLLTERGWSPGSGYYVDQVPANPAQTISFNGTKGFSSNIQGLTEFKFYTIVLDTVEANRLKLYVDDPDSNQTKPVFDSFVELTDGTLKIMQLGCIEGCHLGFRKNPDEKE